MTVADAVRILDGQFFSGEDRADLEVQSACEKIYEAGLRSGGTRVI